VLAELMDEEVCEVVGPKGRQDPAGVAVVTPRGRRGDAVGRRVDVERPPGVRERPMGRQVALATMRTSPIAIR